MTTSRATALAHPNIALAKYWGKLPEGERLPAVPSLSLTLAGLSTRTTVVFDPSSRVDSFELDGTPAPDGAQRRVFEFLDKIRELAGSSTRARVVSTNDYPTAAGLASSAAAFAALAVAASRAAGLELDDASLSDLARRSSVSAARSIYGGWVALPVGTLGQRFLAAEPIASPEHWDLSVLVAVTHEGPKPVGSTEGMLHTARTSPYYQSWLEDAPRVCANARAAVLRRDLEALGTAAEQSALRMHASSLAAAPGLVYWNAGTLEAVAAVRDLRSRGHGAWFTIDAGPHVKVLTTPQETQAVSTALAALRGVIRIVHASPGPGVTLSEAHQERS